jgi:hypothetical protein
MEEDERKKEEDNTWAENRPIKRDSSHEGNLGCTRVKELSKHPTQ